MGRLLRAISNNKTINMIAIDSKDIVEEARKIHQSTPLATAALGRVITAGAMMGVMMKEEHAKMTLQFKGNGPVGMLVCVSNSKGDVKGYISHPKVDLPIRMKDKKLDVSKGVGTEGTVSVIRDLGLKEPYVGQYPITNGEIAEDLTAYYANSEQVPSSVALGVLIDVDGTVKSAGGFIVQLMPDVSEEDIETLERNLRGVLSISHMLDEAECLEQIIEVILGELGMNIVEERQTRYFCDCSRERMKRALISMGTQELEQLLKEDGRAELTCHFCNERHVFEEKDLKELLLASKVK